MQARERDRLTERFASFAIEGRLLDIEPLHRGHIHDTLVSRWQQGTGVKRFLHQRMNDAVFPDIELLMRNVRRITEHLARRTGGGLEALRLVPTRAGDSYLAGDGEAWRSFHFIENTHTYDRCTGPEQAFAAARAFGQFQASLADLPASELGETLPEFFSSPARLRQFEAARAAAEAAGDAARLEVAREEIEFVLARADQVPVLDARLRSGHIPTRVVHGDTKLNNVLFDQTSGVPRAIVDLDTCMPGYSLYDFGDLVRFTAATCAEDERDLSRAGTDLELYRALAEGYLDAAASFLNAEELQRMPFAARLVTLTIGMRFLTDHLAGDVYFKVERPGHNLDRARVQFAMVRFMERHEDQMRVA